MVFTSTVTALSLWLDPPGLRGEAHQSGHPLPCPQLCKQPFVISPWRMHEPPTSEDPAHIGQALARSSFFKASSEAECEPSPACCQHLIKATSAAGKEERPSLFTPGTLQDQVGGGGPHLTYCEPGCGDSERKVAGPPPRPPSHSLDAQLGCRFISAPSEETRNINVLLSWSVQSKVSRENSPWRV